MNDKTFNVVLTDSSSNEAVAFRATPEKLGKFISSLLGQPQRISRHIHGVFDIDLSWLTHINALIDQRIKQQNDAARASFRATIYYTGDLTRVLESVESLDHYAETKKICSTGIRIHWVYVIRFPSKEIPEKQEIELEVNSNLHRFVGQYDASEIFRRNCIGSIEYSISHTERTWGDDIETILRQEIESKVKPTSRYEVRFKIFMLVLAMIFFLAGLLVPEYINDRIQNETIARLQPIVTKIADQKAFSALDVPSKIDIVAVAVNPENAIEKVGFLYRVISAFVGLGLTSLCFFWSDLTRASFLVLTKEAENERSTIRKREKRRFLVMLLSFAASVIAGILGNYAYLYLVNY